MEPHPNNDVRPGTSSVKVTNNRFPYLRFIYLRFPWVKIKLRRMEPPDKRLNKLVFVSFEGQIRLPGAIKNNTADVCRDKKYFETLSQRRHDSFNSMIAFSSLGFGMNLYWTRAFFMYPKARPALWQSTWNFQSSIPCFEKSPSE